MRILAAIVVILGIVSMAAYAAPSIYIRNQAVTEKPIVQSQKIYLPAIILQDKLGVKIECSAGRVEVNGELLTQPVLNRGGVYYLPVEETARKAGYQYLYSPETQMVDIYKPKAAEVKPVEAKVIQIPAASNTASQTPGSASQTQGGAGGQVGPGTQPSKAEQKVEEDFWTRESGYSDLNSGSGIPGTPGTPSQPPQGNPQGQGNQPPSGQGGQPQSGNQPGNNTSAPHPAAVNWLGSLPQAMDDALAFNKNIFLFCYDQGNISAQMHDMLANPSAAQALDDFICVKLDEPAARDYGVDSFPKIAVISQQGVTLSSNTGIMGLSSFLTWLKAAQQ